MLCKLKDPESSKMIQKAPASPRIRVAKPSCQLPFFITLGGVCLNRNAHLAEDSARFAHLDLGHVSRARFLGDPAHSTWDLHTGCFTISSENNTLQREMTTQKTGELQTHPPPVES